MTYWTWKDGKPGGRKVPVQRREIIGFNYPCRKCGKPKRYDALLYCKPCGDRVLAMYYLRRGGKTS